MEAVGLALGAFGFLVQAFQGAHTGYKLIHDAGEFEGNFSSSWALFANQREIFFIWAARIGLTEKLGGRDGTRPSRRLREQFGNENGERRCQRITDTLKQISLLFNEAEKIGGRYGLKKVRYERKVLWALSKEDEFEKMVKKLSRFNMDLERMTEENNRPSPMQGRLDHHAAALRIITEAAANMESAFEYFNSATSMVLLRLENIRAVKASPATSDCAKPLHEWLDFQFELRPWTTKFNISLVERLDSGLMAPHNDSEAKLLIESFESVDGREFAHSLSHITTGLRRLLCDPTCDERRCNDLVQHFRKIGTCLGGFSRNGFNSFVYYIPTSFSSSSNTKGAGGGVRTISLPDILPGGKESNIFPTPPSLTKRVRLACLLSISFLQFFKSSWFPTELSASDIAFIFPPELLPSLGQPYLKVPRPAENTPPEPSSLSMSASSSQFDTAAFHLALLMFEIITWLPHEKRTVITEDLKTQRLKPTYVPEEFDKWLKKQGVLKELNSVAHGGKNAVRICLLGGFGRGGVSGRGEEEDFEERVVEVLRSICGKL